MIDLHTHTNESDGTYAPQELVQAAIDFKLDALAITDHDTFAGFDQALPFAREHAFDLICGIELSTRMFLKGGRGPMKNVHLLGYFLSRDPTPEFRSWLHEIQGGRRERNRRLVDKLKSLGVDIELSEIEAIGRSLAGRPHFARILVQKGYAKTSEAAFREFIGEDAPGFVERDSPLVAAGIKRLLDAGAIASVAHPVRLGMLQGEDEEAAIAEMREMGLQAIEVYHSDHSPADRARYQSLADKYGLLATGGSDFHGAVKPRNILGSGINGNVQVPPEVLVKLRTRAKSN